MPFGRSPRTRERSGSASGQPSHLGAEAVLDCAHNGERGAQGGRVIGPALRIAGVFEWRRSGWLGDLTARGEASPGVRIRGHGHAVVALLQVCTQAKVARDSLARQLAVRAPAGGALPPRANALQMQGPVVVS